jgi:D-cysteine desulfhydrase
VSGLVYSSPSAGQVPRQNGAEQLSQRLTLAFPRAELGTFPTPVHLLDSLSAETGAEIWVKRDDRSGEHYGGNHLRKLEFILAAAQAADKRRVLTYSCLGSNYAVAMALYGRKLGLTIDVVQSYKLPTLALRRNLLLTQHYGASIYYAPRFAGAGVRIASLALRGLRQDRTLPYFTHAGASTAVGTLGFVAAGLELAAQIESEDCAMPDRIFVTVSSCGTAAGLLVGLGLAGMSIPIIGVRVVDGWMANQAHVMGLARGASRLVQRRMSLDSPVTLPPFTLIHDYFGGGYGAASTQSKAAVAAASRDGLTLENTYTGKTFAAVLDWANTPENRGKRALFWNTYNSVDQSSALEGLDYHALPPNLWTFFECEIPAD